MNPSLVRGHGDLAFIRITDTKSSSGTLWIVGRDGKGAHQVQGLPQPIGAGEAETFGWPMPMAPILNLSSVLKYTHQCGQRMEIIFFMCGRVAYG
jgi:hypothetical protein